MTKEEERTYKKAYYLAHKEEIKKKNRTYYLANKQKMIAKAERWRKINKEKRQKYEALYRSDKDRLKDQRLKTTHGITLEQFTSMAEKQGHKCGSCGKELSLCVDHDHVTGKIRGLLCNLCNVGIGALGDDVEGLKKALVYLEGNI